MDAGTQQWRGGGRGPSHVSIHRGARSDAVSRRDTGRPEGRPISPLSGEAAIHRERRWQAAATGGTDGAGPGGADGGEDRDRANLRGRFRSEQLWISTEEERDGGPGSDPHSGEPRE